MYMINHHIHKRRYAYSLFEYMRFQYMRSYRLKPAWSRGPNDRFITVLPRTGTPLCGFVCFGSTVAFKQLRSYRDGACLCCHTEIPCRRQSTWQPTPSQYTDTRPTSNWNTHLPILMSWLRPGPTIIKLEKILKDFYIQFSWI